jgi:predicted acylesterase/phospholipase RssA
LADHYSPGRRTALILTGTGADGAYHAGALRALHETGLKIDIVGGRGIGALAAVLYAIDGAARLWEPDGVWWRSDARTFYRWRWPFRWLGAVTAALLVVMLVPVLALVVMAIAYPFALALGMAGLESGARVASGAMAAVGHAFSPDALPTWIPRTATALAVTGVTVLVAGAAAARWRAPVRRTPAFHALWALLGTPVDGRRAVSAATRALWSILRGGAALRTPDARDLSRRYADLLADNLGLPGFRDLLLVVHDLDVRRDMVFGLVRESFRRALFAAASATASLPAVSEPRLVSFSVDAYWRGEAHRLADRPASVGRLIEEAAAVGAEQVILVTAAPEPGGPHDLRPTRTDGFGRLGEQLASAECAAVGDALRQQRHRFHGVYVIRPVHNPVRPMDLGGAYDERSDRVWSLGELMERGYEDAYRQFIEPVVGEEGER